MTPLKILHEKSIHSHIQTTPLALYINNIYTSFDYIKIKKEECTKQKHISISNRRTTHNNRSFCQLNGTYPNNVLQNIIFYKWHFTIRFIYKNITLW